TKPVLSAFNTAGPEPCRSSHRKADESAIRFNLIHYGDCARTGAPLSPISPLAYSVGYPHSSPSSSDQLPNGNYIEGTVRIQDIGSQELLPFDRLMSILWPHALRAPQSGRGRHPLLPMRGQYGASVIGSRIAPFRCGPVRSGRMRTVRTRSVGVLPRQSLQDVLRLGVLRGR